MRSTKNLVSFAMLSAMAYTVMFFIRIPIMGAAPFLKYDPKDIAIVIGGFMFGPLAAFASAFAVAFLEMVTVSESGIIGMLMNLLSSAAFACSAAAIYRFRKTLAGAVAGLAAGCALATSAMLLWNYIITPVYMGVPRPVVASMLVPVFLPFNLIKSVLNAAAVMLLYKPVSSAIRLTGFYTGVKRDIAAVSDEGTQSIPRGFRPSLGVLIVSAFVILSTILLILILQGKI